VAGERKFRDFRKDNTLDTRQFQMAFRLLRQMSVLADDAEKELDVDGTIRDTCDNAGSLKVRYRNPRKNAVKVLLLMDSGANVNVTADYLVQWALMGSIYMKNVFGIDTPEVGLLNNGAEEHKGTQIQIDTYAKLKTEKDVKFIGNVEGKELPQNKCDVLVTDGFTGNVTLKLIEGMAKFMFSQLKTMYTKNMATKMSYLVMKDELKGLKNSFDASEYGGAPLLGLQKPVIKAHGSSDAKAIFNAVRQAEAFISTGVIDKIGVSMAEYTKKQAEAKAQESAQVKDTNE